MEVGQRASQPVDLVDHHHVDLPFADVGQQALKRRTLYGCARETAVVIGGLDQAPALALLTMDECLARFTLGVERVEVLRARAPLLMTCGCRWRSVAADGQQRRLKSRRPEGKARLVVDLR
jgi:hypothetical protein